MDPLQLAQLVAVFMGTKLEDSHSVIEMVAQLSDQLEQQSSRPLSSAHIKEYTNDEDVPALKPLRCWHPHASKNQHREPAIPEYQLELKLGDQKDTASEEKSGGESTAAQKEEHTCAGKGFSTLVRVPEEEWSKVEKLLKASRRATIAACAQEDEAFEALDSFLGRYGDRGKHLAARWLGCIEVRREVSAALVKAKKARKQRLAEQQRRLDEAQLRLARNRALFAELEFKKKQQRREQRVTNPQEPRCYMCGFPGVKNSRKCPNIREH